MPKTKKINKKLSDTFFTYRGEEITRKQLSQKMSRANSALKKSKEYLTQKEYEMVYKTFTNITKEIYGFDNLPYSLKGVHDVKKLRQIEQAVYKTLNSTYLSKRKYKQMREKQTKNLMKTINVNGNEITYNQAVRMRDIFSTDIWHHLIENKLFDSSQIIELLASTGWLDNKGDVKDVIGILENIEDLHDITNIPLDELLLEELENAK